MFGLAQRILGDRNATEEATLDVYLQVWRQAGDYDSTRGNPLSWLCTMARSRAIDQLRASTRRKRLDSVAPEDLDTRAKQDDPEQSLLLSERGLRVREAIDKLNPEQGEVIQIAYFSGLTHSEIAERLGQPLGTVKTRIRHGMMRLRELLLDEERA